MFGLPACPVFVFLVLVGVCEGLKSRVCFDWSQVFVFARSRIFRVLFLHISLVSFYYLGRAGSKHVGCFWCVFDMPARRKPYNTPTSLKYITSHIYLL